MPPASASTLERGPLELVAALARHAEQRHHAPERGSGAHRAEQVLAIRDGVPADHDLVVDRLQRRARGRAARWRERAPRPCPRSRAPRPRRPRRRRPRRSGGRGRRPRAPPRARAGQPAPTCPSGVPAAAGSGSSPAGAPAQASVSSHQPREWRSSQPVREASESSAPCSPPRPWTIHSPTLSQRTPRSVASTWSRSQRYFETVRSARGESPVVAPKRAGSRSSSRAVSSSPRESCQAIDGDHRLAVAVEQHAGLGHARHADARDPALRRAGERLVGGRERALGEPRRMRSPRRSGPRPAPAAPGRARPPRPRG